MAQPAYSSDPEKINEPGKDKMRFELGDTMVEGGVDTCALTDAEYTAIIEATPRWKRAKLRCLESILFRVDLIHETEKDALQIGRAHV